MAKIQEQIVIVRLSKLVKNSADSKDELTNNDFFVNLETIVQELVGDTVIVEIEKEDK